MKTIYFTILIFFQIIMVSSLVSAAGTHLNGNVSVEIYPMNPNLQQYEEMYGQYNVRWNSNSGAAEPYIRVSGTIGGSVYFQGRDWDGNSYYCYIPTSSALYQQARRVRNTAGNGSFVRVRRTLESRECDTLEHRKYSDFLD